MATSDALDLAHKWLGPGYRDMGGGRYVSSDGLRQFRMTVSDITGAHGGGPHLNFEEMMSDPMQPGKLIPVNNTHINLGDAP
jgi:hypothetical protein